MTVPTEIEDGDSHGELTENKYFQEVFNVSFISYRKI